MINISSDFNVGDVVTFKYLEKNPGKTRREFLVVGVRVFETLTSLDITYQLLPISGKKERIREARGSHLIKLGCAELEMDGPEPSITAISYVLS